MQWSKILFYFSVWPFDMHSSGRQHYTCTASAQSSSKDITCWTCLKFQDPHCTLQRRLTISANRDTHRESVRERMRTETKSSINKEDSWIENMQNKRKIQEVHWKAERRQASMQIPALIQSQWDIRTPHMAWQDGSLLPALCQDSLCV